MSNKRKKAKKTTKWLLDKIDTTTILDKAKIINLIQPFLTLYTIWYFFGEPILYRENSINQVGFNDFLDKYLLNTICILITIFAILYGKYQNKLRKDEVEHLCARIEKLEKQADKDRSGSGLTSRGDTHPKDV